MAGEWIKITNELPDKEEVHRMSAILNLPAPHIVGLLLKFWVWCDRHLVNGNALVTPEFVSRHVGEPNFHKAMIEVGWLKVRAEGGFSIPKWDRHTSKSAKNRALTLVRVQRKRNERGVTKSLPEKEIEKEIDVSSKAGALEETKRPPWMNEPDFVAAWTDWESSRKESGKPIKPTARRLQLAKLTEMGHDRAIATLRHSAGNNYTGLYEPDRGKSPNAHRETRAAREHPEPVNADGIERI